MNLDFFEHAISTKRGTDSTGEMAFVAYLARLLQPTMIDGAGNLHFDRRGTGRSRSRTLFVAHTDTICRGLGTHNEWRIDKAGVYHAWGDTLGADDAAGLSILVHLMSNSVPGYYVFFRGEEAGGEGSRYLAKHHADLLMDFDRAIAFDRAGTTEVITHQSGGRCASDVFGEALADALNAQGLLYMPSDRGIFTDTANLMDIVPECTNVAVGYENEHGSEEAQDGRYLSDLGDAVLKIDWEALPTERDPAAEDPDWDKLPTVKTEFDRRVYEAFCDALEKKPRELMSMVGKMIDKPGWHLDMECFVPEEVYSAAAGNTSWEDVLDTLALVCTDAVPSYHQ